MLNTLDQIYVNERVKIGIKRSNLFCVKFGIPVGRSRVIRACVGRHYTECQQALTIPAMGVTKRNKVERIYLNGFPNNVRFDGRSKLFWSTILRFGGVLIDLSGRIITR